MMLFNIPVKYNEFIFSVNESQRCISETNCVKHWREIYPVDSVLHMIIGGVLMVFLKLNVLFFRLFLKLLMISFASNLILLTQISLLEAA